MADRYWVGGTANWDGTAGTKWATTDGGTGGASVPTSADNTFFTALSGAVTVTNTANVSCADLNFTGFTGTFAGSTSSVSVFGNFTAASGMTWSHIATLSFNASSGSYTITTNGKAIASLMQIGGVATTATWTLGDPLTNTNSNGLFITQGTFTTNNFGVTALSFVSSNTNIRTINLGNSAVTLSGSTPIDFTTNTNLTFNAGTSSISCTAASATFTGGTAGGGLGVVFYNVLFTSTAAAGYQINAKNTFNNLSFAAPASAGVRNVAFDNGQTINGTLSTTGTAGNRRVWLRGLTHGIAQTFTINSAPSLTDADFRDIYVIGTAAPISGTRIGDLRGCRGITFSTPKTVYWNLPAGGNWSDNAWAPSSGGTVSTNNFPLAQDTAVIENTGLNTSAQILFDSSILSIGTIDMSLRTNAMTLNVNSSGSTSIYGNWKNGSGTTISNTATLTFSGRNTQTITSAGKTFAGGITVDSYGGSIELADALNIGANALTVTNGIFDTKSFNVTAGQLSSTNSNVRTINLGSSTVTLSAATVLNFATSTNLTFIAGTSQINTSASTAATLTGGGNSFYNVSFNLTAAGTHIINGANTFNNLTITAPTVASLIQVTLAANQTITGTLTVAGASSVRRIFVRSDILGTTRTLNVATLSADNCDFRDIAITGAAAGSSPTRAGNCGGNTGITFPAAKTVYWNLAGAQNWSATAWAPGSGGTPDINQFPLAQDTAVFDNTGSVTGTITINAAWNIGTFDASLRTTAMTLTTGTNAPFVYGDWKFGTGITSTSTTGTITFASRGTETITSNGVQFGCPVTVDCVSGTVQLADAISIGSTRTLTLTSGTFDAVTFNVTTGFFTLTGGTLKMGSGTWSLSGNGGTLWNMGTPTAFYKGTADILFSNTFNLSRTFAGNSLSYNKFTITPNGNTLTVSGNNQFTEFAAPLTISHAINFGATTQTFGKWTVSGGNFGAVVVSFGGNATHILAGSCTSGLDYLFMSAFGFATTSPGEFYAGPNSTGTAGAPVYRTAKPADSTRYWVGGTGNWSDTARWSTSSGGSGGASVPRSHDNVVFDSASNATAYTATVDAVTGGVRTKALTIAGPASGNVTLAGTTNIAGIHGSVTLPVSGMTRTYTGSITLSSNFTGLVFTTNGVLLSSLVTVNGVDCSWTLGSSLDTSGNSFDVINGSFNTSTYNLSTSFFSAATGNSRTINFGSSTVTISGTGATLGFGTTETERANLTFIAGTSQITYSGSDPQLLGNNQTFYNVSFTSTSAGTVSINGANSFNNLSFTGITTAGLKNISLPANQTVTGTLTFSAGTNATMRHFCRSDTIGTTRTITAAAVSMTDVDFRDITIAGAAAPASGTRIGDGKGNSGITFTAAANKYWNLAAGGNWGGAIGWATSSGGTPAINNFPLAQDTCFFEATGLNSGATVTVNAGYNIGTINMSARTANTMTLAQGSITSSVYGNWVNGTGVTLTGAPVYTFAGRTTQQIMSAGKQLRQLIINSPGGSVTLQDALDILTGTLGALTITAGTFDANVYNVTISNVANSSILSSNSNTRTIAIGSGIWTIVGNNGWDTSTSTNLTVTGTGTISLTSASAKTFAGGSIAYTNITLNQGGAGTLTIGGNNTFKDITNTYKATGATTINMGTTTQRVSQWTAAGEAGRLLTIQGTSAGNPCTLNHIGAGTAASVNHLVITGVRAY